MRVWAESENSSMLPLPVSLLSLLTALVLLTPLVSLCSQLRHPATRLLHLLAALDRELSACFESPSLFSIHFGILAFHISIAG